MLFGSVLSLLSVSNSRFSLWRIASGIGVCLFAFHQARVHTSAGVKSVRAEVWKCTILVCVCSVAAAKSILRLLVACVTFQFVKSLRSHDAAQGGFYLIGYSSTNIFSCMCVFF